MTGYKHIANGLGILVEGIEDSDGVLYAIGCNGKLGKIRFAKVKESTKGLYFVANIGGCRIRQYLHDFVRC